MGGGRTRRGVQDEPIVARGRGKGPVRLRIPPRGQISLSTTFRVVRAAELFGCRSRLFATEFLVRGLCSTQHLRLGGVFFLFGLPSLLDLLLSLCLQEKPPLQRRRLGRNAARGMVAVRWHVPLRINKIW